MNRPIKFMAWDKGQKKWTKEFMLHPDGDTSWIHEDCPDVNDILIGSDASLDLYQFTGLLDKEGKEIYEGHIIKWKHAEEDSAEGISKVVFGESCGFEEWEIDKEYEHGFELGRLYSIEIIGHIAEGIL